MFAEFSVYPMGQVHFSKVLAEIIQEIRKSGLEYQLGPMGTSLKGHEEKVFSMIQRCLEIAKNHSERVVMNISIDNDLVSDAHLNDRVNKVMGKIAKNTGEEN